MYERFGVKPLDFDSRGDSQIHEFDASGHRHMQYLADHGPRFDLPLAELEVVYRKNYPHLLARLNNLNGDIGAELEQERVRN